MDEELAVHPPGIRFNPTDDVVTLPPGFRFHPTDEELLSYYLKRKICGKTLHFDAISEIDLYKYEPWDLPEKSCLKTRDLEWYFFSPLDKKYGIGLRANRATGGGYWKVTGKDREIRRKPKIVGLKKTLVFHQGRAPRGERTNWVMHEYRLEDGELTKAGIQRNSFVLCRVFQKSGPGPKTHEQYGAAFIEEEWDESVAPDSGLPLSMFSSAAPSSSESPNLLSSDHGEKQLAAYGSAMQDSCDQTKDIRIRRESSFLAPDFDGHESCNYFENGASFLEEKHADQKLLDVDGSYLESNDLWNSMGADYPTDETVDHLTSFDAPAHDPPIEDGSFLEVNDLLNTMEPEASGFEMLDDLLTYFDATDHNLHSVDLDSSSGPPERVDLIPDHSILAPDASSLVQKPETCDEDLTGKDAHVNAESDVKNDNKSCRDDGILSKLVGSIALPPEAFTESKYPMKGAKSIAAASSSSAASIHVTAATILISSVTETGVRGKPLSSPSLKSRNTRFILSFGFLTLRDDDDRILAADQILGGSSVGFVAFMMEVSEIETTMMLWSVFNVFFLNFLSLFASFKLRSDSYTRYQ